MLTGLLLLLVVSMTVIFPIIIFIPAFRSSYQPQVFIGMTLLLASAYGLTRTRYYTAAAWLTVLVTSVAVWVFAYLDRANPGGSIFDLMFVTFPVILCGLLLSARATAALAAINLAVLLLVPFLIPESEFLVYFSTLLIFAILTFTLTVVATAIRQRDRDELQRQSRALAHSQERLQLVSFATNDAVWDWDLMTNQIWRNQNVRRLLGYKAYSEQAGIEWWQAQIHPDDREKFKTSIRRAIESGEDFWSNEYRIEHEQGNYAYVFDRAYIMHDDNRRPIRMVGAMMDITERKRVESALRELSVRDPLTGLFNRRYLEETLNRELLRAARGQRAVGVIMADIDHFKRFNDTYGHLAGDDLLREVGGYLGQHIRGADIACRYGGEEFTIILPDATIEMTRQRAEHLRQGAKRITIKFSDQPVDAPTLSLGVAGYPTHGKTVVEVLAAADAALYEAKESGRDQVIVKAV
jgi:diguanylate cyclase (GGDEF)-like protein/PAS domain S-box-containing protein